MATKKMAKLNTKGTPTGRIQSKKPNANYAKGLGAVEATTRHVVTRTKKTIRMTSLLKVPDLTPFKALDGIASVVPSGRGDLTLTFKSAPGAKKAFDQMVNDELPGVDLNELMDQTVTEWHDDEALAPLSEAIAAGKYD